VTPNARLPAVAGRFYPADPLRVTRELDQMLSAHATGAERAIALIAPHAGWVYSGRIAAAAYARTLIPSRVIVICPNHTGLGASRALWPAGEWALPGGAVRVDEVLADAALRSARLTADRRAHLREHAIEVQLPFLQRLRPDLAIVPICLGRSTLAECHEIGVGLARAIVETGARDDVLIVASTDMSHYVPANVAKKLDGLALERLLGLDPDGLYQVVTQHDISMCGFIPTTVALVAALELGAAAAELVMYGNSGEVSGDLAEVVGYAGVVVR
jgi:MEMO1 family protein